MKDCLFCKIINGEIPSNKIYEDELVFVFLDINPMSNGHMLIIPKKHYLNINDIDIETRKHIFEVQKKMNELVIKKLGATGSTFIQNNGDAQEVKHYHMHLIPRYSDSDLKFIKDESKLDNVENIYNKLK